MHRHLGTRNAASLSATTNDATKHSVVEFQCCLYPSGSGIVINDRGNIVGVRTTISSWLLPSARNVSDFLAGVWQTGDCSIHDWHNGWIYDWCYHQQCEFVIPSPVLWELLTTVIAHPLPSNGGIHIGKGNAGWLNKGISRGVAMRRYRRRPVTQAFFVIIFCIYTSSGSAKESSGH